jgi:hypothetical protein
LGSISNPRQFIFSCFIEVEVCEPRLAIGSQTVCGVDVIVYIDVGIPLILRPIDKRFIRWLVGDRIPMGFWSQQNETLVSEQKLKMSGFRRKW